MRYPELKSKILVGEYGHGKSKAKLQTGHPFLGIKCTETIYIYREREY